MDGISTPGLSRFTPRHTDVVGDAPR